MKPSQNDFDWLGEGVYFWESDPRRAKEYADWRVGRGDFEAAAVIGAVIDLRNCLDLTNREDLLLLAGSHARYQAQASQLGKPMPQNANGSDDLFGDLLLRRLDCAVINYLHKVMDETRQPPFDTVRGMFTEGGALFPGAGIQEKSHTQIAVRNAQCIVGFFWPRDDVS